jgi:hypothetical protein
MENLWRKIYIISNGGLNSTGEVISNSLFLNGPRFEASSIYDEVKALETKQNDLLYLLSETNEIGCYLFEVRGRRPSSDQTKTAHQIAEEKAFFNGIEKKLVAAGLSVEIVD